MESIIATGVVIIILSLIGIFFYFVIIGIADLFEREPVIAFLLLVAGGVPLVIVAALRGFAREAEEGSPAARLGCFLFILFGVFLVVIELLG